MGSKGRIPPPNTRHPLPGPDVGRPEMHGRGLLPPPVGLPRHDMLPPSEILEQKLAAQHMEMERLAIENQRLAATHGSLRQQLAAAQKDIQMLDGEIGAVKVEREKNRRGLVERIANMEAELKEADHIKLELQQTRAEAQSLAELRQELFSKVQKLSTELQRAHVDVQQIPVLLSELDRLRQEFQQYRATYEHERKVYLNHVESLQVMDKEYRTMAEEVTKLRAELSNAANIERRAVYGGATGYGEDASGHNPTGRSSYQDGYGAQQVHASFPTSGTAVTAPVGAGGTSYGAPQSGSTAARSGYDASRALGQETHKVPAYDPSRSAAYDTYKERAPYDPQRASSSYEMPRAANYDKSSRGVVTNPVQPPANVAHGSTAPSSARTGAAAPKMQGRGGNTARR